jgi:hypothetical protein
MFRECFVAGAGGEDQACPALSSICTKPTATGPAGLLPFGAGDGDIQIAPAALAGDVTRDRGLGSALGRADSADEEQGLAFSL